MGIDRSDPADGPGDAYIARRARSAPDNPDAIGKDRGTVSGDPLPDSSSARSNSPLRSERTTASRAHVDAVYRQYAIDHGYARGEKLKHEPVTSETLRSEGEKPQRPLVVLEDGLKAKGRLAEGPRTIPGDRSGDYDVVSRGPIPVHGRDLPEGYKSSPALKGDPYHPNSVSARSAANQELYAATSRDQAAALGYTMRIPAHKAPFDSHGQEVFTNGKSYITSDVDGHNVTNGWKMFSRRGVRIGTYDSELNYVKE